MTDSSRRNFVTRGVVSLVVIAGATACQRQFTCVDETGLNEAQKAARKTVAYTDTSSDKNKLCEDCVQWVAGGSECGTCKVLVGPIHPRGTCTLFAAKS